MQLQVLLVHLLSIISLLFHPQEAAGSMVKPGCPEKCGNLTIPYPFGIGTGCYLDKPFEVTCNKSVNSSFLPYLDRNVLEISLDYVLINTVAYARCFNMSGENFLFGVEYNWGQQFSHSHTENKLVAIGCDIFTFITDPNSNNYISGCASLCNDTSMIGGSANSSCSGFGCCQTTIPKDLTSFYLYMDRLNTFAEYQDSLNSTCSIPFLAQKDFSQFDMFNVSNYNAGQEVWGVPVVLDWTVRNISCEAGRRTEHYACKQNSDCIDSTHGIGYKCRCSQGYQGNPYLPKDCQDIDECKEPNNICKKGSRCTNTPGSYYCTCLPGYLRNVSADGYQCILDKGSRSLAKIIFLGIGIAAGILILIASSFLLYRKLEKRKRNKIKQKFFKRNGGLVLQKQIFSSKESVVKTKLFVTEELEKATDNFNKSRVLGKGGLGTVYKGMLPDGSIVAVKKSNMVDENQVGQFINEVIILSEINHRNIVKLLGCCLETEVPLLVYEYVSNGTLSHHLHDKGQASTISWNNRLRIAGEVAGAIAYLHSYASTAIFHRDIKSSNILLDENYRAVVSDFGLSRSVPLNQTHLTTLVGGTFGYLDPEYFRSGQLTDKSDVYAFGVVLAELLTGEKAISSTRSNEGLVIHFQSAMKENRLSEILETPVVNEGKEEEIVAVAKLAMGCLKLNAKKRPSMKDVAADLDQLRRIQYQPFLQQNVQDTFCSVSSYTDDAVTEDSQERPLLRQNFQDHHCSVSERSYSYTMDTVTEDSQDHVMFS